MDIMRTRYFFHGLTEEVVKRTVPGWGLDTAFAFTSHEDGGAGGARGIFCRAMIPKTGASPP